MYRKVVSFYDAWQDWLFPRTWVKQDRIKLERRLGVEKIKKYVEQDTWVLEKLAVHPRYQKEGVGTTLLKWGTEQAQAEGKKIFLRSSYVGLPFYLKRGFEEIGYYTIRGDEEDVRVSCMLWSPACN